MFQVDFIPAAIYLKEESFKMARQFKSMDNSPVFLFKIKNGKAWPSPFDGRRPCLSEQFLLLLIDMFPHIVNPRFQFFGGLRLRIGITGNFQVFQSLGQITFQGIPITDIFGDLQADGRKRILFFQHLQCFLPAGARFFCGEPPRIFLAELFPGLKVF